MAYYRVCRSPTGHVFTKHYVDHMGAERPLSSGEAGSQEEATSEAALAILRDVLGDEGERARRLVHRFVREFLAAMSVRDELEIHVAWVKAWVVAQSR
jgi:hypothetical protein